MLTGKPTVAQHMLRHSGYPCDREALQCQGRGDQIRPGVARSDSGGIRQGPRRMKWSSSTRGDHLGRQSELGHKTRTVGRMPSPEQHETAKMKTVR